MNTCPKCRAHKERHHVACSKCWEQVPRDIRQEVRECYAKERGSARHTMAVRRALESLDVQQVRETPNKEGDLFQNPYLSGT